MSKIFHEIKVDAPYEKILEILLDYENADKMLTPFNYSVKKTKDGNKIILNEKIKIPILNKIMEQKSTYNISNTKELCLNVTMGIFKGTKIEISVKTHNNKSKILIKGDFFVNGIWKLFSQKILKKILYNYNTIFSYINCYAKLTNNIKWKEAVSDNGKNLKFYFEGREIILKGWYRSAIAEIFCSNAYGRLAVQNKTVIDVGANIGDSSIYFALKNAEKVIAIEPFPNNYKIIEENILLNNLHDKIVLLKGALGSEEKETEIDISLSGKGYNINSKNIEEKSNLKKIHIYKLENIFENYELDEPVLKLDCEGCEYETILESSEKILKKFKEIFIEYHNGYEELENKLQKLGFKTEIIQTGEKIGYIIAKS